MRRALAVAVLAGLVVGGARAQSPAPAPPAKVEAAPVLSELDRLKLINAIQAVELGTLKVQAAAAELARVRGEADKLISGLQVPGWVLNEKLEYVRPAKDGGGGER